MRLSKWLPVAMTVAGTTALRFLSRRHEAEQQQRQVSICLDLDDVRTVAIRAGLALDDLLGQLAERGATHVSLPEWTLQRLMQLGKLAPQAPAAGQRSKAPVGHWNFLVGEPGLVRQLAGELRQRLPQSAAEAVAENCLVFAGDLPTMGEIGLGFDLELAQTIQAAGLGVVPRPVSFAWPLPELLRRSLAQAAQIGRYVAFAGDMILGHEMHLDATVAALAENELTFVYFAESRHQKGDWFIAKRRAPHLVLGHQFTPQEMVPLDYHAACHNWAHFARERGIRFCYVNFFRVLHATAPLEALDYIAHLRQALQQAGFTLSAQPVVAQVPSPGSSELALAGLATAGIAATAVNEWLDLPERWALPLTAVSAAGGIGLPFLEQARNQRAVARLVSGTSALHQHGHEHDHHHHDPDHDHHHHHHHHHDQPHEHSHDHGELQALYPPSYAPKLLSLGLTTMTPVANLALQRYGLAGWGQAVMTQAAAAGTLALLTSGPEYQLRIEEYRGFNLDWLLPLAAVSRQSAQPSWRLGGLALLAGCWLLAQRRGLDPLAQLDPGHAQGHTHHISAAMAMVGDLGMAVGPRPARKWSGLGPAALAAGGLLKDAGQQKMGTVADGLGVLGTMLSLVGFRRPERALAETWAQAGPSLVVGSGLGLFLLLLGERKERD